jgi:hypothetical protein
MSDTLFILTVTYACYVIYSATAEAGTPKIVPITANKVFKPIIEILRHKKKTSPVVAEKPVEKKPTEVTAKVEKKKSEHVAPKRIVAATEKDDSQPSKRKAAPKIELRTVVMTHPKTGEEAKVTNNYRMTKRWVKEALITEGLLEKIYKNTELDAPTKIKVSQALSIIKAMDKYKVYSK